VPRISEQHYHQGRAIYDGGGTIRQLIETQDQFDKQADAAHRAVDAGPDDPNINRNDAHQSIADTFRDAAPSLITGFLDGLLVDVRRINRSRGQTA